MCVHMCVPACMCMFTYVQTAHEIWLVHTASSPPSSPHCLPVTCPACQAHISGGHGMELPWSPMDMLCRELCIGAGRPYPTLATTVLWLWDGRLLLAFIWKGQAHGKRWSNTSHRGTLRRTERTGHTGPWESEYRTWYSQGSEQSSLQALFCCPANLGIIWR